MKNILRNNYLKIIIILELLIISFTFFFTTFININKNYTNLVNENPIIFFSSPTCLGCQEVHKYLDENNINYDIIEYNVSDDLALLQKYAMTYNIPVKEITTPLILAGKDYYHSSDNIIEAINTGDIINSAKKPVLEIDEQYKDLSDSEVAKVYGNYSNLDSDIFTGLLIVITGGIIDGFNPCAIAMLLLFISLLGFSKDKKILIYVSFSYIAGLYIAYFLFGTVLFSLISVLDSQLRYIATIFNLLILSLAIFLFTINLNDYFVSKNEKYEDGKNQLPKCIQKLNKRIIAKFTNLLEDPSEAKKQLIKMMLITFILGFIISLTEFMCTGQVYLAVIVSLIQIKSTFDLRLIIYLLIYNLMFVMPLIIISLIAIKTRGIMAIANFMREKQHITKMINALLFLLLAIYYYYKIFF